ncbi:DivIVA domain-containing protein [Nocardia heshunensis]
MLTMLLYVLIVGLVAALLFLVASAIFGRSEELGPLPEGTTATVLPAAGISGGDVRALRFQQVFRGYKAGEVDWALTRLAARIDELEGELARVTAGEPEAESAAGAPESEAAATPGPLAGIVDGVIPQVIPGEAPAPAPSVAPATPTPPAQRVDEPGAR